MTLPIGNPPDRSVAEMALRMADSRGAARATKTAAQSSVREVKATRTALSSTQAAAFLRQALTETTGVAPSEQTVAIVTAQWAHETGHGASMYNYNFGGIKGVGPSGLSVSQRTREGWGSTEVTIVDRFRAYQTPQEGANDYIRLLNSRYPAAIAAASNGDPRGFVRALKSGGYFTGDAAAYERSVTRLAAQFTSDTTTMTAAKGAVASPYPDPLANSTLAGSPANAPSAPSTTLTPERSLSSTELQAVLSPLVPRALVGNWDATPTMPTEEQSATKRLAPTSASLASIDFFAMSDQVARAALQVAYEDTHRRNDRDNHNNR